MPKYNFYEMVRTLADTKGDGVAFTFLEDGTTPRMNWTYADLDMRARAIAAQIRENAKPGARALLLFPSGLDFLAGFFGCLHAGVIAIPAPPPEASRLKRTAPRLRAIALDAGVEFVLTTEAIRSVVCDFGVAQLAGREVVTLASDLIGNADGDHSAPIPTDPEAAAYLQYTSGSTSTPKGVEITHSNLKHHLALLQSMCAYTPDSVTVTWMPNFHDYGLVEGLLEPLYNASPCYIMSPFAFVKRPAVWLGAISRFRATHSQAPNFAYDLCVRRITSEQRKSLDLQSWLVAGNAAEPINPKVLTSFAKVFAECGFRSSACCPAYGLAEATLLVSHSRVGAEPVLTDLDAEALEQGRALPARAGSLARTLVSCGRVTPPTRVKIVDPVELSECLAGEVGEVWVSGPSVARGYWNRSQDNEEIFSGRVTGDDPTKYLRTGDLGFLLEGELYITGRHKDLIIIRGTNHYPQDIEWTVQEAHGAFRPEHGAAFSVLIDGQERLVVAQEVERGETDALDVESLAETVRAAIAEAHEIDLFTLLLLPRGQVPKTASGKIQRQSCRALLERGEVKVVGAWVAPHGNAVDIPAWLRPTTRGPAASPQARPSPPTSPIPKDAHSRHAADALVAWLREYAERRINSRLMDERRSIPPYIFLDFGNQGLFGLQIGTDHGGLALGYVDTLRVLEQLAAIDLNLAGVVLLHNSNGLRPIDRFAKPALRDSLLPALASGRALSAFALSEPGAGSNLGGLAASATADGKGGWVLNGVKRWNQSAWAQIVNVFVRERDTNGRLSGVTGFVVRTDAPGVELGPEALTMGWRGSVQNSVSFNDVTVGPESLLSRSGDGMRIVEDALAIGRLYIAAAALGSMKRCSQLMLRYASRRVVDTGFLLENPLTRVILGRLGAQAEALQAMIYQIATQLDAGRAIPTEVFAAAKIIGSEFLNQAAADLMQLLGGRGYMENNLAPQILRDARVLSVGEGPTEPLLLHLGRRVRHAAEFSTYLSEVLSAPALARRIVEAAQNASHRIVKKSHFSDYSTAQVWTDALVGRAAAAALLHASLTKWNGHSADEIDLSVQSFTAHELAIALRNAEVGCIQESYAPEAAHILSMNAGYTVSIGDIEQKLPGEEWQLDPLLRRDQAPDTPSALDHSNTNTAGALPLAHSEPSHPQRVGRPNIARAQLEQLLRQKLSTNLHPH